MRRTRSTTKKEEERVDTILKELEEVEERLNRAQSIIEKKKLKQQQYDLMRELQNVSFKKRDTKRRITNVNKRTMYNKEADLPRISEQERENYSKEPVEKSETSMDKATKRVLRKLHNIDVKEQRLQEIDFELQKLEKKKKDLVKEKENLEKRIHTSEKKMIF